MNKRIRSASTMAILSVAAALAGCGNPGTAATGQPSARVLSAGRIEVRYVLPEQDAASKSTAKQWSLAAPVEGELSDPNRIVYDRAYMEKYVEWAIGPIACGPAAYVIVTPQGEMSFVSGPNHLGQKFKAEDLIRFLKTRTTGNRIERVFRVKNAEAVKVLRDYPESKQLQESPWDRDTRMVIQLLGLAQYEPAYASLVGLTKDANPGIRFDALIALGRMAGGVPAAIDELEKLLGNKDDGGTAAEALAMAGEGALPAILRALDHPDWMVRNHVVCSLGSHADPSVAVPALRKVLAHSDAEMREWGVAVVADLIAHGGPEEGKPYVAKLASCLLEDTNPNTRRGAALALLNMKSFAAPAEAALRQAAADQNSEARDIAQKALEGLKFERER
jgi:hypothetical protein